MRGEYKHTIDSKGRLILPAKIREELGDCFVIFKGLDNCLNVFTKADWEVFAQKITQLPMADARKMQRFFADNCECEPDSQGRIMIPQSLREYAGLKKDVVVAGVFGRAEIWDSDAWKAYNDATASSDIADTMSVLGI